MADLSDDILESVKSIFAQAESMPAFTLSLNSKVFSGGDVLIITGDGSSEVFLLHSHVLKKAPYFAAIFSGRWAKPKPVTVDGDTRDLWVLELYFDVETNLVMLKHQDTPIDMVRRLQPINLTGRGLERWESATNDDDYTAMLAQTSRGPFGPYERPPRLQFKWSESQIERFEHTRHDSQWDNDQSAVFPQGSLQFEEEIQTYATFLNVHEEEFSHLDDEIYPREDKQSLPPREYTHDATLKMARKVLSMLFDLLYGNLLKLPATYNGADAAWLCAHLITISKRYCVFELIAKDLEYALLHQPKNRLGRAIYHNPRFYLMLGYHLKSVPIYIDAVKHVVGPSTQLLYQRQPHHSISRKTSNYHVWSIPDDFNEEAFPREVVQFLVEVRYNMSQAAWETREKLMQCLNPYADTEHIYDSRTLMSALHSALENKMGLDYSQEIVRRPSKESKYCEICKTALRDESATTYNTLCWKYQHSACFSEVPYSTHLHGWGDMRLAGHEPAWSWPPQPAECYPFDCSSQIECTDTKPATVKELEEIGCLDIFKVHLSQEKRDVAVRRAAQRQVRELRFAKKGTYY